MNYYVPTQKYVWIECNRPGYEGFRVEVRLNLTQGERTQLRENIINIEEEMNNVQHKYAKIAEEFAEELEGDKKSQADTLDWESRFRKVLYAQEVELEQLAGKRNGYIAPHIRAWNLYTADEDGNPVPVAPPSVAGADIFNMLDKPIILWITNEILMAYRGGKGLSASLKTSSEQEAPTPEPTQDGPQVIDMSNTRPSRRKSSGR